MSIRHLEQLQRSGTVGRAKVHQAGLLPLVLYRIKKSGWACGASGFPILFGIRLATNWQGRRTRELRIEKSQSLVARFTAFVAIAMLLGCGSSTPDVSGVSPRSKAFSQDKAFSGADDWGAVLSKARGQTVRLAMWDGDAGINAYMRDEIAPSLESEYGVGLTIIGLAGSQIANKLIVDLEANRLVGDIDVCWINGENFHQLRRVDALAGPFTERLPNQSLIDWSNRFIGFDFQQPVAGYECPWGCVQFALIHHCERVPQPPRTAAELETWVAAHPGRFTFDNSFTGMTFLKCLLNEFAGGGPLFAGPFDEARYLEASAKLWTYLRRLRPHLWRGGQAFPEGVAQLHQLFANGEVDFTMSNNDGEVDSKVAQGVLLTESRAYVLRSGTIRNAHYLGIPRNSPRQEAALVLINHLISPQAQLRKAEPTVWGDGTVLAVERLPLPWREKFEKLEQRRLSPPRAEMDRHALMEPAPEVMVRLIEDFRREIIEQ
jgi:putative spermidine/putrescine transport system substrate-binding protein